MISKHIAYLVRARIVIKTKLVRESVCTLRFFFSSRGRHTRCYRDWSSDVCSSDLDAEPMRPRRRLAVMDQGKRAEQLHRVGVELRLPAGQRRAEVEVARASRNPRLVVAQSLLAMGLLLGVVRRGARLALFPVALLALGLGSDVRGDLLHEPI